MIFHIMSRADMNFENEPDMELYGLRPRRVVGPKKSTILSTLVEIDAITAGVKAQQNNWLNEIKELEVERHEQALKENTYWAKESGNDNN